MIDAPIHQLRAALAPRYRVEKELGSGGMATVYLAEDLKHQRRVAIKLLRRDIASVIGPERFLREIAIAASLHHPNILQLYDSGDIDGLLYYVMPYVEDDSLRTRLQREKQLPIDEAVRIASEVADALHYAHGRGIVHRDIKPENVLLESGHALVADFGIARAISTAGDDRLTGTGMRIGTPTYMSPEQGGDADVDARSDIYSLGCVIYEMLAGDPPFHGSTPQAVLAQHALERVPSLEIVRPTVGNPILNVIERTLAKSPADRYQTAADLRVALAGEPVPLPRPRVTRRFAPAWVAAGVVLAIAVTVAALGFLDIGGGPALNHNRVVVFPLVATDPELTAAGAGWDVALAIGAALEHSQPLQSLDGWTRLSEAERADPRVITPRSARDISVDRRAGHYIDGAIRRTGRQTSVVLRLHDVAGDSLVVQETASGPAGTDLSSLALDAATPILARLLEPGRVIDLSPLRDRDPGANALFIQGERRYRNAQYLPALDFYRRAVQEDSLHAFAAVKGAQVASWMNRLDESEQLIRLGLANADLLPEKFRLFARGLAVFYEGWADSAVMHFRSVLRIDPRWAEAWMALGETYFHLLPDAAPLDSLAEAAFRTARDVDPTFTPPLLHLAEMAARRGDVDSAAAAVTQLEFIEADTTMARSLSLILACVREPSPDFPWGSAVEDNPAAVALAGKELSVAAAQNECALGAFRAILARPDLASGVKWGGLVGAFAVLLAEGRYGEARTMLDSSVASGMRSAYSLYTLGALAGAPFAERATEVERLARRGAGEYYERARPEVQWMLATWHGQHGRVEKLETIAARLHAQAQTSGDRTADLLANALDAQAALGRGDSLGALRQLSDLRSSATSETLAWNAGAPLAFERHLLAQLQLARGDHSATYRTATVFDHPGPIMFLPFMQRSLEIRADAASALGRAEMAQRLRARLESLRTSDRASSTSP